MRFNSRNWKLTLPFSTWPETKPFRVVEVIFRMHLWGRESLQTNFLCSSKLTLINWRAEFRYTLSTGPTMIRSTQLRRYATRHIQISLQTKTLSFCDVFFSSDQRKIREAKILSKLTHPNVLRLFEWWIERQEDSFYLYMQLEYYCYSGYRYQPTDLLTYSYLYMNPMPR